MNPNTTAALAPPLTCRPCGSQEEYAPRRLHRGGEWADRNREACAENRVAAAARARQGHESAQGVGSLNYKTSYAPFESRSQEDLCSERTAVSEVLL
jgi:hypothetical protein